MSSEVSERYMVHVLDIPAGMDDAVEANLALVLVLLKRHTGFLLAVPEGFFSEEALSAGLTAEQDAQIGVSTVLTIPAGEKFDLTNHDHPVPVDGGMVSVVLVDVSHEMEQFLSPFIPEEHNVDAMHGFDFVNQYLLPLAAPLTQAAWLWIQDPSSGQRVAFYSADEELVEDVSPRAVPLPARSRGRQPSTRKGVQPAAEDGQRKPRATVATLAASLEKMSESIPRLADQMSEMQLRQQNMEERLAGEMDKQSRPSALRQPLGSSATLGSLSAVPKPSELLREMPPPSRNTAYRQVPLQRPHVSFLAQEEVAELEGEKMNLEEGSDLAKAILAQSQALTSLVQHLASSDPLQDLASSSSSTLSSKGTQGRQRLQQELAQQRGTFFTAVVLQAMSRRMQPTRIAEQTPQELALRGITPSAYLERFGGYGKVRELGCLQWQVGLILEHLQNDQVTAAKDATALLCVCLEQMALDGGRSDIGLLLSLTEEPPAGVFTNRSMQGVLRGRPFAPLADQKWITTALAFIKEMDLIASRRLDATSKSTEKDTPSTEANPKKAPKKHPKGKGKVKAQAAEEDT